MKLAEDTALSVFPLLVEYHVKRSEKFDKAAIDAAAYDAFLIAKSFLERREIFSDNLWTEMSSATQATKE